MNDAHPYTPRRRWRVLMLVENCGYPDDTRIVEESRCLRDAGYVVRVICPSGVSRRRYECVEGVHLYRYPRPPELRGLIGYVWEYAYSLTITMLISLWLAGRHGFDVIHVRLPPDFYALITKFFQLLGKHYVADLQDLSPELYQAQRDGQGSRLVHKLLYWFELRACRTADRLITTNETQRQILIRRTGIAPDRCHVVRNAPDRRFLEPAQPLENRHADGRTVIGYMGLFGVQDRVDVLLHAAAFLKNVLHRDDFRVVIIGSGPAFGELKQLVSDLGLEQQVWFTGYLTGEALRRHMASFDICVTPDPSNAYNDTCTTIKTMEYMAMGKPIVAFDLPENRVTTGDAALYATGNDVRGLATLIANLIDRPTERVRLGQIGRQRILERFTWDHQLSGLLHAYAVMLGQGAACPRRESVEPASANATAAADEHVPANCLQTTG